MRDVTTFKGLQRETSVYKYFVELKENSLTGKGFLDLVKVPGLFVAGTGQFLKNLRLENRLLQKDIAIILGVCRETVKNWELNKRRISLKHLVKFAEVFDISRDMIYSLIEKGNFKIRIKLPLKVNKIRNIVQYLSPQKFRYRSAQIIILKCRPDNFSKTLYSLNIKPKTEGHKQVIYSKDLHRYLTTFFRYNKVPKIHPPLTAEVKDWYNDDIDLKHALVIPCLQSDGSMDFKNRKRLRFYGDNRKLHDFFVDAMYLQYNEMPSSYFMNWSDEYCTAYDKRSIHKIVTELLNLAGNTKTSPAHEQTVEEYLYEPQPNLSYLFNATKTEQKIALRIWASAEGSISIVKHAGWIYPALSIACAHPNIAKQLQDIAKFNGIHFNVKQDQNTWSGIGSLVNRTLSGCLNFLKIGAFIKGIKISSNSPYHEGIEKNTLILGILEYFKRGRMKKRDLPIEIHHNRINQIIHKEEYQSADYYLDYFS
ncbi:MAG: helix-turn-helix transcriptional regulator [Candidatus Sifarchaeia archaeon]|jgi:transcriptional regulator with XRE-family HTH domain